ncbi:YpiB family protein [Halalkalibacter alkaliphilus]|uniref:YpiB family protein n=1 Tax=Halalkalibacter alkaliphilus TaxID=2917993 RepID=A0A9X2CSY4_9BACI|nr:YpiB family protein [Halalkalibacter alkaliphilus]MCL7747530.1 YpiB family protein [Halalkalibacter alkaliphilus]
MRNWVSASEKSSFLKWFLEQHQLKHKDVRMLLEHILKNHHILENLSFVETVPSKGRTFVISSMHSDKSGFVYYYNKRKSEDVSKALGDLMSNPAEKVYVKLHFYGKQSNHRYLNLVESQTNSFVQYKQFKEYEKETNFIIEKALLDQEIEKIRMQIDEALDQNDKPLFNKLVERLQELKSMQES